MELGLIHLYCGEGKGKTTAAMGLAVRAAGRNKKVLITQFLKDNSSGEIKVMENIPCITFFKGDPVTKFFKFMSPEEQSITKKEHTIRFKNVIRKAVWDNYDILIMDEIIAAINLNLIELNEIIEFLKNKPRSLEIVMTGRNPRAELIEISDYVSEIKAVKHPYEKGITSRIGIEK